MQLIVPEFSAFKQTNFLALTLLYDSRHIGVEKKVINLMRRSSQCLTAQLIIRNQVYHSEQSALPTLCSTRTKLYVS